MDLLSQVKEYLRITWEDEAEDRNVLGFIAAGVSYLNRKAGFDIPFEGEDADIDAVMLLKDYVRYARSNALDEFEGNYSHEIGSLREKYESKL